MWQIEIDWNGKWVVLQTGFKSQGDAEWATGLWKQKNDCRGDPFRAVVSPGCGMALLEMKEYGEVRR